MGLQFYKPNAKKTGAACTWDVSAKAEGDKCVYVELIKQTGWDADVKTGSFKDGAKLNVKFTITELGEILHAIETVDDAWKGQGRHGTVHQSPSGTTLIKFYRYGNPTSGYALTVSRKVDGEDVSISMGFRFSELRALKSWIEFALEKIYSSIYAEDKKRAEAYKAKQSTPKAAPSQPSSDSDNPIPF